MYISSLIGFSVATWNLTISNEYELGIYRQK